MYCGKMLILETALLNSMTRNSTVNNDVNAYDRESQLSAYYSRN